MPDNEVIKAVLDAIGANAARSDCRNPKHQEEECEAPDKVFYFIFCKCVTINNGACGEWEFCNADGPCRG